jgi:quercetin dioxygenase-like cupin family protein
MRRSLLLVVSVFLVASAALAQDPAKVDPQHCKVEFENAQVRVLHWKTGPHEKSPMHSHPAFVSIPLTNGHERFTFPDGTTKEIVSKAGEATWSAAQTHASENLTDEPEEIIQVELKSTQNAAQAKMP